MTTTRTYQIVSIILVLLLIASTAYILYVGTSNAATTTVTSTVYASSSTNTQLTPITIQIGTATTLGILEPLAEDLGFFAQQGLAATIVLGTGGASPVDAVVAGTAQFGGGAGFSTVISAEQQGQNLTILTQNIPFVDSLVLSKAAAANATSFGDLNGLTIGTTAVGSSSAFFMDYVQAVLQQNYSAKITVTNYSSDGEITAFCNGQVNGIYASQQGAAEAVACGGVVYIGWNDTSLWDQLVPNAYAFNDGLVAESSYVQSNPAVCQEAVNAVLEAKLWLDTANASEVAKVLAADPIFKVLSTSSATSGAVIDQGYISSLLSSYPNGYVTQAAWQTNLNIMTASGAIPSASNPRLSYQNMIDMTFVSNSPWALLPTTT